MHAKYLFCVDVGILAAPAANLVATVAAQIDNLIVFVIETVLSRHLRQPLRLDEVVVI